MSVSHACDLKATIRSAVCEKFSRMAVRGRFHFHYPTGRSGLTGLGYGPPELIDGLPAACATGYCGVGNVLGLGAFGPGERVCDMGCGTGSEALLAARLVGPTGRVVGLDLVPEMLDLAWRGARRAAVANVDFVQADAAAVPLSDASFDVVVSNGVLNMVVDKEQALADAYRLLRPGGRLHVADLTLLESSATWRGATEATFFQ